jgi:hypothetical protein
MIDVAAFNDIGGVELPAALDGKENVGVGKSRRNDKHVKISQRQNHDCKCYSRP